MARTDNEVRITLSVLDRLLDYSPRESREPPKSRSITLRELKQAVQRDLEWLLNTRCHTEVADEMMEEILKSVACYGLPDFTGMSVKNANDQQRLTDFLESAVRNFEPRFRDLKVTLEPMDDLTRELRFRIEARLDVEPAPEPIAFDTVLQVGTGDFAITPK